MKMKCVKKAVSVILTLVCILASCFVVPTTAKAAPVIVNDNGSYIVVNTNAGLVYTINKSNGDMTSCKYNGRELCSRKASHINSGLGSARVSLSKSPSGSTVVITVDAGTLTHYYVSRSGQNIIYMATYISREPDIGCLRYIFRGNSNELFRVPEESNIKNAQGLEGGPDVFKFSNGITRSKYYGNEQAKDLRIKGCTGNGVGVFVDYGSRETCQGGPFYRDIQFQSGADTEIYNVMNHGIGSTEDFRMGLYGPYAYIFTNGSVPGVPDYSFMSSLNLKGYVRSRGTLAMTGLKGMDNNYEYTYTFTNAQAQYWVKATNTGYAKIGNMKPGTYTMNVYKGELSVYSEPNIVVTANQTTILHTKQLSDPSNNRAIFRIGNWDGTPLEFLNGRNISLMHPSDVRNASWGPVTYWVGGNHQSQFPAIQFRGANTPTTVHFNLSSGQASVNHTFNIGITSAYNNGRPKVVVNGRALEIKSASNQPKTRCFTVGTYRGNNTTFSWNIPASYLNPGDNVITIEPISGNSDLSQYLSASFSYDCVELLD